MNKQIEIYKRLHGKYICQRPGCNTVVMGAYCMVHIESAIALQWEEIEAAVKPRQLPTGENHE